MAIQIEVEGEPRVYHGRFGGSQEHPALGQIQGRSALNTIEQHIFNLHGLGRP
jgi:hypothetical protein